MVIGETIYAASADGTGVVRSNDNGTTWVTTNLNGNVFSLAMKDGLLYAGGWNGVNISQDSGRTWRNSKIYDAARFPFISLGANSSSIFAGVQGMGIYRSNDSGLTWVEVNSGLTNKYIWSLVVTDTTLLAGTGEGGGVFRSTDNGATWAAVNTGLTNQSIQALAVSGTTLFAGTLGGVFRAAPPPALSIMPTRLNFGTIQRNQPVAPQSYTLFGSNLPTNATVTAPAGIGISLTQSGTYSQTLTLAPIGGSLNQQIWVRPETTQARVVADSVRHICSTASVSLAVNSEVIALSAALQISLPAITFANTQVSTFGAPIAYTISGQNLTAPITVTAPAGVQIVTTGTYSNTLTLYPTNGSLNQQILTRFSPMQNGVFAGFITHTTDGTSASVRVSGTALQFAGRLWRSAPTNIGNVLLGESRRSSFTVSNGTNRARLLTADWLQNEDGAFTLLPGQLPLDVRENEGFNLLANFSPTAAKTYSAALRILGDAGNGVIDTLVVPLTGAGVVRPSDASLVQTTVRLRPDTARAKQGRLVRLQLLLDSLYIPPALNAAQTFSAQVQVLTPEIFTASRLVTPNALPSGASFEARYNGRLLDLKNIPRPQNARRGLLADIEMEARNGDTNQRQTLLRFIDFRWNDIGDTANIRRLVDSVFAVEGCAEGGARGFRYLSPTALASVALAPVAPNPIAGATAISYSLKEETFAEIFVVSTLGQRVVTLASGRQKAGEYTVEIPPNALPNGLYLLILQTPHECLTQQIGVTR